VGVADAERVPYDSTGGEQGNQLAGAQRGVGRHRPQYEGIHHVGQCPGAGLDIPADPSVSGREGEHRIGQADQADQLVTVRTIQDQKPQPAAVPHRYRDGPVQRRPPPQQPLEASVVTDRNEGGGNGRDIDSAAPGELVEEQSFVARQRLPGPAPLRGDSLFV
jgi:hypothetical protein